MVQIMFAVIKWIMFAEEEEGGRSRWSARVCTHSFLFIFRHQEITFLYDDLVRTHKPHARRMQ